MRNGRNGLTALLLLALLLTLGAMAEGGLRPIGEIAAQTPERWTQTYETTRRDVSIDVAIDVPDVDAVPVFRVQYMDAVPETLLGAYAVEENGAHDYDRGNFRATKGSPVWALKDWTNARTEEWVIYTECMPSDLPEEEPEYVKQKWLPFDGKVPEVTAENLNLSAREAFDVVVKEVRALYGDAVDSFRLSEVCVYSCF